MLTLKPIFDSSMQSGAVSMDDLETIATIIDTLLSQANDAVWFYNNY